MKYRVLQFWENLYLSYWFYPTLFAVLGLILGLFLGYIDIHYNQSLLNQFDWLYRIGPEGAREIFAVIATSAITITSVSFSIGILILSQASRQLGSRILINFFQHNHTQIVLGIFIGTFIFCLINLRLISNQQQFVPTLSLILALILGITIFFVLIYFINTIANFIQIDCVLTTIENNLTQTILRQFPKNKLSNNNKKTESDFLKSLFTKNQQNILALTSGYLQTIDYQQILTIATNNNLVIKILKKPGNFIAESMPVFCIASETLLTEALEKKLLACLGIGYRRTTSQDIELGFEELSEIALRALSPSINDPYTAKHCLDRMLVAFIQLSKCCMPASYHKDQYDQIRLIIKPYTYKGIINSALDRLRQSAVHDLSVSIRLLQILAELGDYNLSKPYRKALLKQVDLTYQGCELNTHLKSDLKILAKYHHDAHAKLFFK